MLDFDHLSTPASHGDVLIVPEPGRWIEAAHANHDFLGGCDVPLLNSTLSAWRRLTREAICGDDGALIFVLGHQPEFIHPGVWAKHVAAVRAAAAAGGVALNLVVDNDAPKSGTLSVPCVDDGRAAVRRVPLGRLSAGCTYEQMVSASPAELDHFEASVRRAMGERYEASGMPTYASALGSSQGDWVDRLVEARRAVEATFEVEVVDRRVSQVWCGPLLVDWVLHAERFAASYNRSLADYRERYRVRGAQRPIPDLRVAGRRIELPVWAIRNLEPRCRLYVEAEGEVVRCYAGERLIGELGRRALEAGEDCSALVDGLGDWQVRPRALALTMWARLLLADLFVHGIGGAKYDRISDLILADYYGVKPPHMACVSATLHLDLPVPRTTPASVRGLRRGVRDLEYNPQRHLDADASLGPLLARRRAAVKDAIRLREEDAGNRPARSAAFGRIRTINAALLAARADVVARRQEELDQSVRDLEPYRIAQGREYFFALYDRSRLAAMLEAIPQARDFRV